MDKVIINESIKGYYNNECVYKYVGIPKDDDVDIEIARKLINKYLWDISYHGDLIKEVTALRTIFKDYDENELVISIETNFKKEKVEYNFGSMKSYEMERKENNYKERFTVKYNPLENISFSYTDNDNNENSNMQSKVSVVEDILKEIEVLKNIKSLELDYNMKKIVQTYYLFYGEYPDFSDNQTNIRFQTMLNILSQFYVCFSEYNLFLNNDGIPSSSNLEYSIRELYPLGKITKIDNPVVFRKAAIEKIKLIGNYINNGIKYAENKEEVLIKISKLIYATKYNIEDTKDINDLIDNTNITKEDATRVKVLVKNINTVLVRNNM